MRGGIFNRRVGCCGLTCFKVTLRTFWRRRRSHLLRGGLIMRAIVVLSDCFRWGVCLVCYFIMNLIFIVSCLINHLWEVTLPLGELNKWKNISTATHIAITNANINVFLSLTLEIIPSSLSMPGSVLVSIFLRFLADFLSLSFWDFMESWLVEPRE